MARLTEKAIMASFIKLLNEMPFDRITVKDIVNDCGINRNTFYYHYNDIYDLLRSVFDMRAEEVLSEAPDEDRWQEDFLKATEFALENKKSIYHIYRSVDRRELEQYLLETAGKVMERYVHRKAKGLKVSEEDIRIITDFYQCAIVGMVMQWLDGGMKQDLKELILRAGDLQMGNVSHMLEEAAKNPR